MTDGLPRTMRADAIENRERILAEACSAFAVDGLDVPMREIARRAGVGPATLYRHFPTKEDLATEAFTDEIGACLAIVDEGLADPDPWHGFCLVVEKICALHACNRGFTAAFVSTFPDAIDFSAVREHALQSIDELARRAKDAGHLRHDFVRDDMVLVLMANNGIVASSPDARMAASRRFAALAVQGFHVSPSPVPLTPLTPLVHSV